MRLLVTGGTGFIGSHLAEEGAAPRSRGGGLGLTDRPEEKANADLLSRHGGRGPLRAVSPMPSCAAARLGERPTFSILPWPCGRAARATSSSSRINLDGTRHLLEAAERSSGSSDSCTAAPSASTGTGHPGLPSEDSPLAPGNIYERTKVSAERLVREFAEKCGLPAVVLRPADVYGPRDQRLLKMFKGVSRGRFPLFGSGEGRRHMVYVDDVVSAFFKACERDESVGQGLIIAGPRSCTLRELIDEVVRATGSKRYGVRLPLAPMLGLAAVVEDVCAALKIDPPIYRRRMDFFHSDSEFDTSRARRVLDWEPKVDLREGSGRTLEDYQEKCD